MAGFRMPVYLDRGTITPLPPVADAMLAYFSEHQDNPLSTHRLAQVMPATIGKTRLAIG